MIGFLENSNSIIIFTVFILSLVLLVKSADFLVDNAVKLSKIWGLTEIIIGATIISFGTTIPELLTSVTSSLQGNGNFAIGNAVGSIITNTSLIIGISALYGNIPVDKRISQKFSLLIFAVFLLIIATIQYKINGAQAFIPQKFGFILMLLIPLYIIFLIKKDKKNVDKTKEIKGKSTKGNALIILLKMFLICFVLSLSASALVGSSEILAKRIGIPDFVIASTIVALGTSLPELSTCISAAKRGHGGLAIGNIMGANILNIIMVVGAATAVTPLGIYLSNVFYNVNFASLILVLAIFSYFAYNTKIDNITKKEGITLIIIYIMYLVANLIIAI